MVSSIWDRAPASWAETVVAALMQQMPLGGPKVFGPLLLQVDQSPLTPAEGKVLNAGYHQITVGVHQASLSQVTPAGIWLSTVTT